MTDSRTRHGRGLIVVIALAVVFLTLLALVVLETGDDREEPAAPSEMLTVLPQRIRIRTEPHARAAVVTTAVSGDRLTLVEDQGAWVRVKTAEGLTGWAERQNLERTLEQKRRLARSKAIRALPVLKGETTARAPLYAGPGIFYPLVGELPQGQAVDIFTRDHDFYAVDFKGTVAYGDVESIEVSSSGTHQLEVQTASSGPEITRTDTTATTTMAERTPVEEPPLPEPEPVREPEPEPERATGVYPAVPPGGTQPEELDRVVPSYPPMARRAGVQGPVVVRGIVRRDGTIDNVEVIRDLPYGLGNAARAAVRKWRFRPATYRGEPIDVYYTVTVNFRLQ
ncbi:MAG TPA: TonB family protein [Thermoanaerobaculia bacterium]